MTKPIFSYHATIHIRSELSGSAMLAHMNAAASTKEGLLEGIREESVKYVEQIKNFKEKDYKEIIKDKKEDKWSNRRIRNHFAKFGITIELPDEKKKKKERIVKKIVLPDGQKKLEGT
ncbi:MAG: hypothetical protein EHM34_07650 [Nitrosopumilales archaeon]|nr:MAG: hypothetical protein EHM34_07650 [Nitrosopumilales archaeon]